MEKRLAKVNISAAGGTATAGAKTCKITLPTSWLTQMGIHEGDRSVELTFDGDTITIKRVLSLEEFVEKKKAAGHNLLCFKFYNFDELHNTHSRLTNSGHLTIASHHILW